MHEQPSPYHPGELEAQRRAGVAAEAAQVGAIVGSRISPAAARFLAGQRLAVAASLDASGQPWASLLSGPQGFLTAVDEQLLRIARVPGDPDPLRANLAARPELGLLVFDPATRRRLRLNGRGLLREDALYLLAEQVYGNCPKYIQKRALLPSGNEPAHAQASADRLGGPQQAWVAAADTLFVASFDPQGGADASHRGGNPGFVRVLDARLLEFDDYPGNNMFNTLGNLLQYPRAGLLFVDFATGDTLQLSGRAALAWEPARRVRFEVERVRETRRATPLRWALVEYSPSNPRA